MIGTAPENEGTSVPILRARRRCGCGGCRIVRRPTNPTRAQTMPPVLLAQAEHNLCDGGALRNAVAGLLVFMRTVLRTGSMRTRFAYNLAAAPAMVTA